jgi:hypothetical protein
VIKTQTCYTLRCDACEVAWKYDDHEPHWPTYMTAARVITDFDDYGWVQLGDIVLCEDCKYKPHAFRLKPNTTDECWRCPNPAEEHDEAATP